jgi:hypothetical protein
MAIDILSIPAMSDKPERCFSGARRTVSWDRGQIEPEPLEMIKCLKDWKSSGILKKVLENTLSIKQIYYIILAKSYLQCKRKVLIIVRRLYLYPTCGG